MKSCQLFLCASFAAVAALLATREPEVRLVDRAHAFQCLYEKPSC
jgi:hypothetical protein